MAVRSHDTVVTPPVTSGDTPHADRLHCGVRSCFWSAWAGMRDGWMRCFRVGWYDSWFDWLGVRVIDWLLLDGQFAIHMPST